jgi:hypothetical protein
MHLGKVDPGLLSRLNTGDTGSDTCVIWVESEQGNDEVGG